MSTQSARVALADRAIADGNGILRLQPAWVARDFLGAGYRLGLDPEQANVGERGAITERWLASETLAENHIAVEGEGLSFLALEGERMSLAEAVRCRPNVILGPEYHQKYGPGLHRLAKLFDYVDRLPYHLHQRQHDAEKVGANAKEEAYYFPGGVELGAHPETFLGCHPWIVQQGRQEQVFLPYLEAWDSDLILQHAPAVKQIPGDGFHVPAGMLHGPGTALTIELQENSDVFSMWQALVAGKIIPKELLFKNVSPADRAARGERAAIEQADWNVSGDPCLYENRHTPPVLIQESGSGREEWIFYNTEKFSGKRLVVSPGKTYMTREKGVYSVFAWRGQGAVDGHPVEGQNPDFDEVLVTHGNAVAGVSVVNTGSAPLILFKFFGKGVNPDCPRLPQSAI